VQRYEAQTSLTDPARYLKDVAISFRTVRPRSPDDIKSPAATCAHAMSPQTTTHDSEIPHTDAKINTAKVLTPLKAPPPEISHARHRYPGLARHCQHRHSTKEPHRAHAPAFACRRNINSVDVRCAVIRDLARERPSRPCPAQLTSIVAQRWRNTATRRHKPRPCQKLRPPVKCGRRKAWR
jgi:hypothetical protein